MSKIPPLNFNIPKIFFTYYGSVWIELIVAETKN